MANLPKSISVSINLDKIESKHVFQGQKGKYLDVRLFLTEDNEYGNDYMAVQGVSKEAREAGERGPILGNGKVFGGAPSAPQTDSTSEATSDAMPF